MGLNQACTPELLSPNNALRIRKHRWCWLTFCGCDAGFIGIRAFCPTRNPSVSWPSSWALRCALTASGRFLLQYWHIHISHIPYSTGRILRVHHVVPRFPCSFICPFVSTSFDDTSAVWDCLRVVQAIGRRICNSESTTSATIIN